MTKILILGGGGMIGQKLARRVLDQDIFPDPQLTIFDRAFPEDGVPSAQVTGTVSDPAALLPDDALVSGPPEPSHCAQLSCSGT